MSSRTIHDVVPPLKRPRLSDTPLYTELVAEAARLEAPMPQAANSMGRGEIVRSLAWVLAGAAVVLLYIGIPLAAVANAIERFAAADAAWAGLLIVGTLLVVIDILKQTMAEGR